VARSSLEIACLPRFATSIRSKANCHTVQEYREISPVFLAVNRFGTLSLARNCQPESLPRLRVVFS